MRNRKTKRESILWLQLQMKQRWPLSDTDLVVTIIYHLLVTAGYIGNFLQSAMLQLMLLGMTPADGPVVSVVSGNYQKMGLLWKSRSSLPSLVGGLWWLQTEDTHRKMSTCSLAPSRVATGRLHFSNSVWHLTVKF